MSLSDIVQRGWEAVGAGDFDTLVEDYVEDMIFIMPGQSNVLEGRQAFRAALDGLGEILPPGFEINLGIASNRGRKRSHFDSRMEVSKGCRFPVIRIIQV